MKFQHEVIALTDLDDHLALLAKEHWFINSVSICAPDPQGHEMAFVVSGQRLFEKKPAKKGRRKKAV